MLTDRGNLRFGTERMRCPWMSPSIQLTCLTTADDDPAIEVAVAFDPVIVILPYFMFIIVLFGMNKDFIVLFLYLVSIVILGESLVLGFSSTALFIRS